MRSVIYFMGSVPKNGLGYVCYEVGLKCMSVFIMKKINIRDNGYTITNCWKPLLKQIVCYE